jgi:hypothetical protein
MECRFVGKAGTLRLRPTNSTPGSGENPASRFMSLLRIPDLTSELKRGLSFVRREKEPSGGKELSRLSKKTKHK